MGCSFIYLFIYSLRKIAGVDRYLRHITPALFWVFFPIEIDRDMILNIVKVM